MKLKPSAVIAFFKLLQAINNESEVFLLDITDQSAISGMQEYNDRNNDDHWESVWGRYTDSMAEKFAMYRAHNETEAPSMPSKEQLQHAEQLLRSLLDRKS